MFEVSVRKTQINRLFVRGFLLILALSAVAELTYSQQSYRNTISGFVFDTQRRGVAQIPIEVTNEVGQVLNRTRTDGSGRFFFSGLSSGRFTIRVLPYGTDLEEQSGDVEIINFVRQGSSTSDSAQKDFYLKARRNAADNRSAPSSLYAQDVPKSARKLYEKGIAEFDSKQVDNGIELLMKAVKEFPEYYSALERLGKEFIAKQRYDLAKAAFLKAVSVNERSYNGWYGLSYSAYALKESSTGIAAALEVIALNGSSYDGYLMLGMNQRQAKNFNESEKALLLAKKFSAGQKADIHWNLALLYANDMGRFGDAANELELYLKLLTDESEKISVRKLIVNFRQKSGASK